MPDNFEVATIYDRLKDADVIDPYTVPDTMVDVIDLIG